MPCSQDFAYNVTKYVVCILLVAIVFRYVFSSQSKFKETFTSFVDSNASLALKTTYSDVPCKVLKPEGLTGNALLVASSYIDANRMKRWGNQGDDKYEYCYINNDSLNNNQDYLMMNHKCSPNEPPFIASFIEDVFEDNKIDKSHKLPLQKCVIKIDKSKLNDVEVEAFWNSVGKTECMQLNEPVRQENLRIHVELEDFYKMNANLTNELQSVQFSKNSCETSNSLCQTLVNNQRSELDILKPRYADCTSNFNSVSWHLFTCMSNLDVDGISLTGRTFLEYSNNLMQLSNKFVLLKDLYTNLDTRYSDSYAQNKAYLASNNALHADYAECVSKREFNQSNVDWLQGKLDQATSNLENYTKMFASASNRLANVEVDYARTGDALGRYTDLYNDANSSNAGMTTQLSQLMTTVADLQAQLQSARQDIYDIGSVKAINDNNQRIINSMSVDNTMYKQAYLDSVNQNTSNLANTYDTLCKNDTADAASNMQTLQSLIDKINELESRPPPPPVFKKMHAWFASSGDMSGHDIEQVHNVSVPECQAACMRNSRCTQFNHDGTCWLKDGAPRGGGGSGVYYHLTRNEDLVQD